MKTTEEKLYYPENAYYDIFGGTIDLPPNAEELLESALGSLLPEESKIFMSKYKDGMTLQEIAESADNLTEENTKQIISTTLHRLRHPTRSRILLRKIKK